MLCGESGEIGNLGVNGGENDAIYALVKSVTEKFQNNQFCRQKTPFWRQNEYVYDIVKY